MGIIMYGDVNVQIKRSNWNKFIKHSINGSALSYPQQSGPLSETYVTMATCGYHAMRVSKTRVNLYGAPFDLLQDHIT